MRFRDRHHAGQLLAKALLAYRDRPEVLVLGLPRGGVPVAGEVARELNLPLDITCPHKIGAPGNPEYAIGAITERGEGIFNDQVIEQIGVPRDYLDKEIERRTAEALVRLELYRNDPNPREVRDKVVILVDDGLATGFTMKAAVRSIQHEQAARVVVAVPVAPPDTVAEMEQLVDEVICLHAPPHFAAVGQFYEDFSETTDEEVTDLLRERCSSG